MNQQPLSQEELEFNKAFDPFLRSGAVAPKVLIPNAPVINLTPKQEVHIKNTLEKHTHLLTGESRQATKFDNGKTDWSLLPMEAVEDIVKVLEFGAIKYSADNWMDSGGFKYTRVLNSLFRHLFAWARGEDVDKESGLSHLAHAGCNIIFLLYYTKYKEHFNKDDRRKVTWHE